MAEKVDCGPIVGAETFPMPDDRNVLTVERTALVFLAKLFWHLAPLLAGPAPLPHLGVAWSGRKGTRKRCAELCGIRPDMTAEEIERRMTTFTPAMALAS